MPEANFDATAADYDREAGLQKEIAARLCQLLDIRPDSPRILDVGCGTGSLGEELLRRCPAAHVDLLDASPAMLALAQARLQQVPPEAAPRLFRSVEDVPADSRYDLIVSSMALQWFDDLPCTLARLQQQLKAGGQLAFALPLEGSLAPFINAFENCGLVYPGLRYSSAGSILKLLPPKSRCTSLAWDQDFPDTLSFIRHLHRLGAVRRDAPPMPSADLRRVCAAGDRLKTAARLPMPWSIGFFQTPV